MGLFFDELGSQGTIGEPFKKAFAEKSMAQGTIEYLVVIGAVVVVALVTVSVLADFSDVSSSVDGLRSIDDLVGTYGLSVRDAVADGDRLFFNLRNSSSDFYDVVGLEVGGVKRVYSSRVGAGASRTFVFNEAPGSCVCSGGSSRVSCPVGVSFVSRNNVERFEFLDLSFECLDYVQFSDSVVDGVKAITTCEELQAMNEDLSGDYVLGGNVDCSGTVSWNGDEGFVPIGNFSNRFRGSFDGQDFNITGLFIDRSSSDQGLFGYADGASIKNVGLVDVDITGDGTVGGLVGRMSNSSIVGSFSSGEVSGFSSVGGLVGLMNNSSIVGSFSSGVVSGSGWNSGGLVGQMGTSSVVRDSFSMGDVSGNNAVGGLVGLMNNSSIVGSFSSGVVSGSGNGVGGLVGQMGTSSVMDSFSMGDVSGNNSVGGLVGSMSGFSVVSDSFSSGVVSGSGWNIGGLVGSLGSTATVVSSYYDSDVSGMSDTGKGVGRTTVQMKSKFNFLGWDFVDVWGINNVDGVNDGYPFLRWQGYSHNFDVSGVPEVVLLDVEDVTGTGAVVFGELVSKGSAGEVDVYFKYRANYESSWESTSVESDVGVGVFSASLSGLVEMTNYEYMFVASFVDDLSVVSKGFFNTLSPVGILGSGTLNSPFVVEDCDQLQLMNYNESALRAHYVLGGNVDCSGTVSWNGDEGFVPIGNFSNRFRGSFDGQDFNITGLFIDRSSDDQGLFGYVDDASIKNVGLVDVDITSASSTAGLIGVMSGSSVVSDSFISGVVSGSGWNIGGLVGRMVNSSVVSDSFSLGDVSGNNSVGGLVGSMSGFSVVSDSFSSGVVSGSGWNIGGLVGRLVNSSVVSDSFSSGVVSGSGNGVGGLVGRMEVSSVVGSFSSGDVSGSGSVGGLVGGIFDGGEVVNSFSLGDVSGSGSVGGLVGEIRYDYASTLFLISVVNSYSIGEVSGSSNIGGLVGVLFEDTVSFSNVFFDSSVSGVVDAVGSVEEGTGGMSCPFLYTWNGVEFEFIADVGGGGGLLYSSPWTPGGVGNPDEYGVPRRPKEASNVDFMHVTDDQLQAKDGKYVFVLREDLDEVNYMDMVELFVVDHPKDVSVFSPVFNGMGLWVDRNFEDMLGLTIKEPISPVSAFDSFGNDVLRKVLWVDGDYVVGRALEWDTLTVDFGDLSDANQIKLLFNGFNAFASSDDYSERFGYLMSNPDEPFYMYAYPFAEVRDADGEWVYAPEPEQLFHAHGYARTNVWDITHWFEVNDFTDFSIRINTHHKVMIDYVAVDISDDVDVNITKVKPSSAVLKEFGIAANRFSPVFDEVRDSDIPVDGNFTRLGDVLELVLDTDDRFVVMKPGDGVVFEFDEVEKQVGMGRSYFVHQTGYYKGYEIVKRLGKDVLEVDPLPFNDMAYYHLDIESPYLGDVVYQEYLDVWNTREVVSGEGEVIFGDLSDSVSGVSGLFFSGFSGVFGRPSSDMVKRNTFVGWDFYDVWDIVDGVSYPFLRNNVPSVIPMPQ